MMIRCSLLLFVMIIVKEQSCKPTVILKADSWRVNYRDDVTLYCYYDLEGEQILSVKWYRGIREFFRYEPFQSPSMKTFPILNTTVNLARSNETQVTLQEVGYELDGLIKCEVTIDNTYKVLIAQEFLSVTSLPKENPRISLNKGKYCVNDTMIANCTSALSNPSSSLSFLLNNEPVGLPLSKQFSCNESEPGFPVVLCEHDDDTTMWTWLPLNVTLSAKHFAHGFLELQCIGVVHTFRHSTTERISVNSTEPKTERVRSSYSSSKKTKPSYHLIAIFVMGMLCR